MKKLVFLLVAVFFTAISANVFAQNTGTTPTPGSTFNYSVTDNSNTYSWTVTAGDLSTDGSSDVTFDPLSADGASVNITWGSGLSIGDKYYVHVIENDGSCTNEKVLEVVITASEFYLAISTTESDECYDGPVSVSLVSDVISYNHGTATIDYTVTPENLGTSTGYSFNITELFTPVAGFTSTPTVTSGSGTIVGGLVTVNNTSAITLSFAVTGDVLTNATDPNGDAADFNQKIEIVSGVTNNGVPANLLHASAVNTANVDVARPNTTTIGTN